MTKRQSKGMKLTFLQKQGMGMGQGQMGMGQGMLNSDISLINDISRAIIGEVHAYQFYQGLAALAPNEQFCQGSCRFSVTKQNTIIGLP